MTAISNVPQTVSAISPPSNALISALNESDRPISLPSRFTEMIVASLGESMFRLKEKMNKSDVTLNFDDIRELQKIDGKLVQQGSSVRREFGDSFDRVTALNFSFRDWTDQSLANALDIFPDLRSLNLAACSGITGTEVDRIGALTHLQELNLSDSAQVTDRWLEILSRLVNLQGLFLARCRNITDIGLSALKGLNLKKLNLSDCTGITKFELNPLALRELNLSGCDIQPGSLEQMKNLAILSLSNFPAIASVSLWRCPNFQKLDLSFNYEFCDWQLAQIQEFLDLRELNLSGCPVTSKAFLILKTLSQLQKLDLSYCRGIDRGFAALQNLTHLEELDLLCTKITRIGCQEIGKLANLRKLNVAFCHGITDDALISLSALSRLEVLDVHGCQGITAAGLLNLQDLNVQVLDLSGCKMTIAILRELRKEGRRTWV